jgi:hypothetical protein
MKKLVLLILMVLTGVSYAQPPRPKFSVTQRNVNFNQVVVGKVKELSTQFRVDSTASGPVTVICHYPKKPQYTLLGDTQFTIAVGGYQNLTVEFAPTAIGQLRDTIFFTHNGDTAQVKASSSINLNGTGIATDTFPKIGIQPGFGFIQFGSIEVGKTKQSSFRIQNTTDTIRQLTGTVTNAHAPYSVVGGAGSFSLAMNDTVRIFIDFAPTAIGTFFDSVTVYSNADSANKVKKIYFTGTATQPGLDTIPKITITGVGGNGINFGTLAIDSSSFRYIMIRNTSTVNKKLTGSIGSPTMTMFTVDSGGGAFSIDSGMTITVKLRAKGQFAGSYRDSLYVLSNAAEPSDSTKIVLRATITTPVPIDSVRRLSVTPRNLDFGLLPPSTTPLSLAVTLKNTSDSNNAISGNISAAHTPFTANGSGAFTLARNETKELNIILDPSNAGTFTDSVIIMSNANEGTQNRIIVRMTAQVVAAGVEGEPNVVRSVALYPNPAKDNVTSRITLSEPTSMSISVFDTKGVEVLSIPTAHYEAGIPDVDFSVKSLPNGIYTVRYSFLDSAVSILMVIER